MTSKVGYHSVEEDQWIISFADWIRECTEVSEDRRSFEDLISPIIKDVVRHKKIVPCKVATCMLKALRYFPSMLFGLTIHRSMSLFSKDINVYVHPTLSARRIRDLTAECPLELSVSIYNICFVPKCVADLHVRVDSSERLRAIISQIIDSGSDIVCIQEGFLTSVAMEIIRKCISTYPWIVGSIGETCSTLINSGSITLSKYPLEGDPDFFPYLIRSKAEKLCRKGILRLVVRLSTVKEHIVCILNTHLNSNMQGCADDTRDDQFTLLLEVQEKSIETINPFALLIAGDFNTAPPYEGSGTGLENRFFHEQGFTYESEPGVDHLVASRLPRIPRLKGYTAERSNASDHDERRYKLDLKAFEDVRNRGFETGSCCIM